MSKARASVFSRWGVIAAIVAAGVLVGAQLAFAGVSTARTAPASVRAVIWPNFLVTVAPATVKHGTILLKVKNRDTSPQQLQINGVETAIIQPGGSVAMHLTLTKPGYYSISLPDQQQSYANEYQRNGTRIKVT